MFFNCKDDFFEKTAKLKRISRQKERELALLMKSGDDDARQKLVENYLLSIRAYVQRLPEYMQSLEMIYRCVDALQKEVDKFDFLQENEAFEHRLSMIFRKVTTAYIADM
ncbi:MAG: hypothetical protein IJD07_01390 [Clostridia bacterium]|nr:hypothetical protein [Clostridia bacterium]